MLRQPYAEHWHRRVVCCGAVTVVLVGATGGSCTPTPDQVCELSAKALGVLAGELRAGSPVANVLQAVEPFVEPACKLAVQTFVTKPFTPVEFRLPGASVDSLLETTGSKIAATPSPPPTLSPQAAACLRYALQFSNSGLTYDLCMNGVVRP
jgi:hypothetical protein